MQYTLRSIPKRIDVALREKARRERKSLNQATIEAIRRGLDLDEEPLKHRDLSDVAGTWVSDRATEKALGDQRRIDPDLWR